MKVTIKDIAKEAGFSIATVSKVLNNKDQNITKQTRDKVLKAAEELNYIPNSAARSLKTRKSNTIGLVIPDITNPFFPELARGAEDKANELGYSIFFCNTDDDFEKEKQYINKLTEKMVDGIILSQSAQVGKDIAELNQLNIPLVLIDRDIEIKGVKGRVFGDNYQGAYTGVKYMINQGYRNIAFITGPFSTKTAKDRLKGFIDAHKEEGLQYREDLILEGEFKSRWGEQAVEQLLAEEKDFDAIFCGNDLIAISAMKVLKEHGIKIPEEIGVLGYDDIYIAQLVDPALTTIRQPNYLMGSKAVEIMVEIIEKGKTKENYITLKTQLIERQSI